MGYAVKVAIVLVYGIAMCSCSLNIAAVDREQQGRGDSSRGRHLVYVYNCGSCHTIPGVPEASATVGPPLAGVAMRYYIAGYLANTPENLARWVASPQEVQPGNAMPDLGVTAEQAEDIAAYLYTLR